MNPMQADSIDQARKMQYAVALNGELLALKKVETGLIHAAAMADTYGYLNLSGVRTAREMVHQATLILTVVSSEAEKAAEDFAN
jgi:hypothetical protein